MAYESPAKKKLESALANLGAFASPELRKIIEDSIASIDHTDPQTVRGALPAEVLGFYQATSVRALRLAPLIMNANRAGCHIEAIVLAHGLIQLSLRGLFVMAWQRAMLPRSLSAEELSPFYKPGSRRGDVITLIDDLEGQELLFEHHAKFLREVNAMRNKAAHGVIFGELEPSDLQEFAVKAQNAAVGALKRFEAWFNNPQPLKRLPPAPGSGKRPSRVTGTLSSE